MLSNQYAIFFYLYFVGWNWLLCRRPSWLTCPHIKFRTMPRTLNIVSFKFTFI